MIEIKNRIIKEISGQDALNDLVVYIADETQSFDMEAITSSALKALRGFGYDDLPDQQ